MHDTNDLTTKQVGNTMGKTLNIVFVMRNPGVFRSFEKAIQILCEKGNKVTVVYGDSEKGVVVNRALDRNLKSIPYLHAEPIKARKNNWRRANIREVVNYANYFRGNHPTPWEAKRWLRYVSQPLKKYIKRTAVIDKILSLQSVRYLLRQAESFLPVDDEIEAWLKVAEPDIVIASPCIGPVSPEVEYIKAARKLGISSAVAVLSWDNLTTKGTFHIYPDSIFVWNSIIAEEAVQLHDVKNDKISITGAPVFDFWFEMKPTMSYSEFCQNTGLDQTKPYILYLCSSRYIARDENLFVNDLYQTLKLSPYRDRFQLLVRPHPLNATIWNGHTSNDFCVWPKESKWTDLDDVKQEYINSIYHSSAVIGINTSAFLESAILDKPCITVLDEKYKSKQTGLGHFKHLLDADFIDLTYSHEQTIQRIAEILEGNDTKKSNRLKFVNNFIRPAGLEQSASAVMAHAIIERADGKAVNH
jgi:hypothetical protein